jgi:cell division protein FtsQ
VAPRLSRRAWLAVVGLVLVLGITGYTVLGTSVLGVRTVQVVGAERVTVEQVRSVVDVPAGFPLARVDPEDVRQRVESLPAVRAVRVERRFPRTLVVTVVERSPVAVAAAGAGWSYVDGEGFAFAAAPASAARGKQALPILKTSDDATLRAAAGVVAGLPAGLRKRVVRIAAKTPDSVTLSLRSGHSVIWGGVERTPRKAQVLVALMTAVKNAKTYDVSAPDAPTTRTA